MSNTLLLASQSRARHQLLTTAGISFKVIPQNANERDCDWTMPLPQLLEHIARKKMECAELPQGIENEVLFVLTADTMVQDMGGVIYGKPESKNEAIAAIQGVRKGARAGTCFCIEKKIYHNQKWITQQEIVQYVESSYVFNMPDECIETYFEYEPNYISISGAVTVEGYALQFLESIRGSYSNILGLPLFEVRQALIQLKFF